MKKHNYIEYKGCRITYHCGRKIWTIWVKYYPIDYINEDTAKGFYIDEYETATLEDAKAWIDKEVK